jgi:hypothetical protein
VEKILSEGKVEFENSVFNVELYEIKSVPLSSSASTFDPNFNNNLIYVKGRSIKYISDLENVKNYFSKFGNISKLDFKDSNDKGFFI